MQHADNATLVVNVSSNTGKHHHPDCSLSGCNLQLATLFWIIRIMLSWEEELLVPASEPASTVRCLSSTHGHIQQPPPHCSLKTWHWWTSDTFHALHAMPTCPLSERYYSILNFRSQYHLTRGLLVLCRRELRSIADLQYLLTRSVLQYCNKVLRDYNVQAVTCS